MQLPLLVPISAWRPPRIADLPDWTGAKRVAIDIETYDPTLRELGPGVRRNAYIGGFSFAIEDSNHKYYVPVRHSGGDNVEDPAQAMEWLRHQATNFTGEIVGANLSYDLDFLLHQNIKFPNIKKFRDVQVAEAIINELAQSYSLETIANKYLGIGKDESLLRDAANCYGVDPKKQMTTLPARFVGGYAEADASLPLQILRRQEKIIDAEELWQVFDLESELLPVLVKMRQKGIKIDQDRLDQVEKWSVEQEVKALAIVKDLTSIDLPLNVVWQAEMLAPALRAIGIQVPLTPKTRKPSIDKNFLKSIKHPVAEALERARKVNKVRTTFVKSVRNHMTNGYIHATINQLRKTEDEDDSEDGGKGARYGRCSCDHPNLQQQPSPDRDPEIGKFWRGIYTTEEGELMASADFSTQEPRQALHYAVGIRLGSIKVHTESGWIWVDADVSAKEMAEKYRNDPNTDNHQMMADIIHNRSATPKERKSAKIIFLGKCYGMGGAKLCHDLGLPTIMAVYDPVTRRTVDASTEEGKILAQGGRIFEAAGLEGQRILDQFDIKVPWVKALSKTCEKAANKLGYVRTLDGRKCRFYKDEFGNYIDTHKSLNRIVQGGSAGQTKKAMIEVDKAGYDMRLQVHDEIISIVSDSQEAEKIAIIMRDCFPLSIPSKCDVAIGKNWGELV